jgi:hypothetical protein
MKSLGLVFLMFSFAPITGSALAGSRPAPFATGAFVCSQADKDSTNEMLMLWADGRWSRGRLFDPASYRVSWTRVETRGYQLQASLWPGARMRGTFRVQGGKLILFAYVPGFALNGPHTGPVSRYTPEIPDAGLAYDRSFQFAPDGQTLTEILPFNSQREPMRCSPGFVN